MASMHGARAKPANKTKVFMNGRSQAVRIPAEYRFRSSEVSIRRDPASGDIILSEGPGTWAEVLAAMDAAGAADGLVLERDDRPAASRPAVDRYFAGGSVLKAERE